MHGQSHFTQEGARPGEVNRPARVSRGSVIGSLGWEPTAPDPWPASSASGLSLHPGPPSRCQADLFSFSPATPLSPSTLVAETISQCPAKGVILIGFDLSNKTLAGPAIWMGELGTAGPSCRHTHQSCCFPNMRPQRCCLGTWGQRPWGWTLYFQAA